MENRKLSSRPTKKDEHISKNEKSVESKGADLLMVDIAQPIGGMGGTNTQTTPGVGPLQGALGGGLMGLQLGNGIGNMFF